MKYLLPLLAFLLGFTLMWAIGVTIKGAAASDRFVQLLEQSQGMVPGSTRVIPACGCTIRYLGTTANGNHYSVHIDRLD